MYREMCFFPKGLCDFKHSACYVPKLVESTCEINEHPERCKSHF